MKKESYLCATSVFLVKIYCKAWFNAPEAHLAPNQDLSSLHSLLDYKVCENNIAEIALTKFLIHLWYLDAELSGLFFLIPLFFFDLIISFFVTGNKKL